MRLSWNEVRAPRRPVRPDWEGAGYEKGETQSFYNDFFQIFGVKRRTVARYEEQVQRLDDSRGFIDLFWPGFCSSSRRAPGSDLEGAREQAGSYFDALPEHDRPRYQLHCDFQTFELLDRAEREEVRFTLPDLPGHVEKFGFILGVQKRTFRDQDPVNIEASERVGLFHDALADSGYTGHDLEQFLVRLVFCFFADDTGIFEPRDIFLDLLENRTREDGTDLGGWMAQLFQILNTPEDRRSSNLDADLARFPYVNGDLFRDPLLIPSFDSTMRGLLIDAGHFDWSNISPAIFGSLFQSVMDKDQRRAQGAHYTTEQNILKVIEPLFLDDLRAEFRRLRSRRDSRRIPELIAFQQRLGTLRFLDPACGCGNFLIIAYRELRALEIEVLKEIRPSGQLDVLAQLISVVDVDQFYGIELGEFPVRIAEVALWMMDHIMNNRLSLEFGQTYARIPLETSPHIRHADALETDWSELLPPEECSYVLGNPPFVGAKFPVVRAARAGAPHRRAGQERRHPRLRNRLVHQGRRIRAAEHGADRLCGDQLHHAGRAGRHSSGQSSSPAVSWTSPLPTGPLPGDRTLAAWPTFTSSSSDWPNGPMRRERSGCFPTTPLEVSHRRANMWPYHPTCSTGVDSPIPTL